MTVTSNNISISYTGNGVSTTFYYPYRVLTPFDVQALVDGINSPITYGLTLISNGNAGANVVFIVPPANGAAIVLQLAIPPTQIIDYVENTAFPAEVQEQGLDKLTLLIQQLLASVSYSLLRTERVPATEPGIATETTIANRAGKWRTWDSNGQPVSVANPSFIPAGAAIFDNTALLRAAATPSSAGGYYVTKGCNSSTDGGGNVWEWSVASTATDDVGTVIRPTAVSVGNPGRYISVYTGARNVRQYGATANYPSTDDSAAFTAALAANQWVVVPPGSYLATFNIPSFRHLTVHGKIYGAGGTTRNVRLNGQIVAASLPTNVSNGVPGNYATYPIGSVTFTGPFQAAGYVLNDKVSIGLGTGSTLDPTINQIGLCFGQITGITPTTITIDRPTKFAYDTVVVNKTPYLQYTGSLSGYLNGLGGVRTITGNYTSILAAGSLLRIENDTGTDAFGASTAYFEIVRVKSITAGSVVLENAIANNYTNPLLVPMVSIEGVTIDGAGYIDYFEGYAGGTFMASSLSFRVFSLAWSEDLIVSQIHVDSDQPRGCGLTWCRNAVTSDVISKNSFGVSDNAAFKNLGCWDSSFTSISGFGTSTSNGAGGQTSYPFFTDIFFTPYQGYTQGCSYSNIVGDISLSGANRAVWMTGLRACRVSDIKGTGTVYFENSIDTRFDNVYSAIGFNMHRTIRCHATGIDAQWVLLQGPQNCSAYGTVRGAFGANNARAVSLVASATAGFTTAVNTTLGFKVLSGDPTDVAFHMDHVAGVTMDGWDDSGVTLAKSIDLGSVTSGIKTLSNNVLVNAKDVISDWTPTVRGAGVAGTVAYGLQFGMFEYSGNFMNIVGTITWTTIGGATGALRVSLPFTLKTSPSAAQMVPVVVSGLSVLAQQYYLRGAPGTNYLDLYTIDGTGVETPASIAANGSLRFNGSCFVD